MNFKNKVIWITGASSGIGEACAYEFASAGATLIISSNQVNELLTVKEKCEKLGAVCHNVLFDLSDNESIKAAVDEVKNKIGRLDILFNNGGISQRATVIESPVSIDRKIMEINFFGGISLTKLVLPLLIESKKGQIVVTTSIAGKFGFLLRSAYCASKHALYGFYESLQLELMDKGISVTFICPGRVKTNISLHALDKFGNPTGQMDEGLAKGIPVEKAAQKIVKAVYKRKREALIGGKELIMVYIKKYFPNLFYNIARKINPT
jgi:short-subunit dehydrogenase